MKQILLKKLNYNVTRIALSVLASIAVMTVITYAASTVGTNFSADGTLSVTATSTLSSDLRVDTNTLVIDSFNDRVGIGTTSPYAKLSVAGEVVGSYFTATTTTASTFPYASSTSLTISNSIYLTSLGQGWLHTNGGTNAITSSTSPTIAYITATSTTATSTFRGGLSVAGSSGLTVLQGGNVGVGTTSPLSKLSVGDTSNYTVNSQGVYVYKKGQTTLNDLDYIGLDVLSSQTGSANAVVKGIRNKAQHAAPYGTSVVGIDTIASLIPPVADSGFNRPDLYGISSKVEVEGDANPWYATNAYNIYGRAVVGSGDTITNYYGLYLNSKSGTGSITNNYGIYQNDSTAQNYFAGNLGIGTTTPQKKLTVSSGSSATTTLELGDIYSGTSKTCFNIAQANGSVGSFYFANGAIVVENNACR